jgi:hypothetical protein
MKEQQPLNGEGKAQPFGLLELAVDEQGYPSGRFPDKASQLLFDLGFSYAVLYEAERAISAFHEALATHESATGTDNSRLNAYLGGLLAKMRNFRTRRLNDRDQLYNAGYLAGARLEANAQKEERAEKGIREHGRDAGGSDQVAKGS